MQTRFSPCQPPQTANIDRRRLYRKHWSKHVECVTIVPELLLVILMNLLLVNETNTFVDGYKDDHCSERCSSGKGANNKYPFPALYPRRHVEGCAQIPESQFT